MRKTIPFLFLFFFVNHFNINAQITSWLWADDATGATSASQEGYSVAADGAGNIYAVGSYSNSTITFGSYALPNAGSYDVFIVKYDANGTIIWATNAGGADYDFASGVATDAMGNVFVTGYFQSASILFGGITLTNPTSPHENMFIVKYSPAGTVLWAKSAGGSLNDMGVAVATDVLGNAIVTGSYSSASFMFDSATTVTNLYPGYLDVFVAKYSSTGAVLWAKSAGGSNSDGGNAVATDTSNNVFVTGYYYSPAITFGTTTLTNAGGQFGDMFIVKYSPSGTALWSKTFGGLNDESGYGVATDMAGNAYVTGQFASISLLFGTDTLTNADITGNSTDVFLLKYSTTGSPLWGKRAGGTSYDIGYAVSTDVTGLYITGGFESPDIGFDTDTLYSPGGNDPMFIAKYDFNGTVFCASALASGGDDNNAVATDGSGNAYVVGDYNTMNPFVIGTTSLPLSSYETFFIAKYNCNMSVGMNQETNNDIISIYPNPATFSFTIASTNTAIQSIKVFNVIGECVLASHPDLAEGLSTINCSQLSKGIYFIQITDANKNTVNKKIIIE